MVNSTNSDIFISIHFNASGNPASNRSGIQTYSYEDAPDYRAKINPYWHNHTDRISESNRLAADIHSSLLAETGAKDAGLLQVALLSFEKQINQQFYWSLVTLTISTKTNKFVAMLTKIDW